MSGKRLDTYELEMVSEQINDMEDCTMRELLQSLMEHIQYQDELIRQLRMVIVEREAARW